MYFVFKENKLIDYIIGFKKSAETFQGYYNFHNCKNNLVVDVDIIDKFDDSRVWSISVRPIDGNVKVNNVDIISQLGERNIIFSEWQESEKNGIIYKIEPVFYDSIDVYVPNREQIIKQIMNEALISTIDGLDPDLDDFHNLSDIDIAYINRKLRLITKRADTKNSKKTFKFSIAVSQLLYKPYKYILPETKSVEDLLEPIQERIILSQNSTPNLLRNSIANEEEQIQNLDNRLCYEVISFTFDSNLYKGANAFLEAQIINWGKRLYDIMLGLSSAGIVINRFISTLHVFFLSEKKLIFMRENEALEIRDLLSDDVD